MVNNLDPLNQKNDVEDKEFDYMGDWIKIDEDDWNDVEVHKAKKALLYRHKLVAVEASKLGRVALEAEPTWFVKTPAPDGDGESYGSVGWKQKWSKPKTTTNIKVTERVSDDLYQKLYQKGYRAGKREGQEIGTWRLDLQKAGLVGANLAIEHLKADNLAHLIRERHNGRVLRERVLMGVLAGVLLVVAVYFIGAAL